MLGRKVVARRGMRMGMLMIASQIVRLRVQTYLATDHSDVSEGGNWKRDSCGEREPSMIGGILTEAGRQRFEEESKQKKTTKMQRQ